MSFFTSLTGLNAATTQLAVTSNNIANAGTTGFKRSRSDFGDIFATSPLQKASTVVGQGTALKQVTQEFSQGNIELSGNSLDLAVTGEGFFPLRSGDGQDLFTRNGSFLLDEQNTVVNSAGQFLQVASVDSLGKADFEANLVPLQIAPNTVGEALATSAIDLEINFPGNTNPVYQTDPETGLQSLVPFNPNDPTTYAKSAAITIFDANGEDFLLTFYYRRTQVASAESPSSKWQTHILLNDTELEPTLSQATDSAGNKLFVNKYGVIKTENDSEVGGFTTKTFFKKYNLDDLGPVIQSTPAKAIGSVASNQPYQKGADGVQYYADPATFDFTSVDVTQIDAADTVAVAVDIDGVTYTATSAAFTAEPTIAQLAAALDDALASSSDTEHLTASVSGTTIQIAASDGSDFTVSAIGGTAAAALTGTGAATAGTAAVDFTDAFSLLIDEDLDNPIANPISIDLSALSAAPKNLSGQEVATIMTSEINRQLGDGRVFDLSSNATYRDFTVVFNDVEHDISIASGTYTPTAMAEEIQTQLRASASARINVKYNYALKQFTFKTADLTDSISLQNTGTNLNALFGLGTSGRVLSVDVATGAPGAEVIPQGDFILPEVQQRQGIVVEFVPNTAAGSTDGHFTIASGSTGDQSSIAVSDISAVATTYFGLDATSTSVQRPLSVGREAGDSAVRGVTSTAAKVFGTPIQFDPDETFSVDELSNQFTITVDNVTETFGLNVGDYNLNSFINALEGRINAMENSSGQSISGVKVDFDETLGVFTFTSGTTGDDSFVQVEGSPKFGMEDLSSSVGSTGTYRRPVAETTDQNQTVYVQLDQAEGTAQEDRTFLEYDTDPNTDNPELPADAAGLAQEAEWRPLFLDKGELTFDTAGRLVSPLNGINLQDVVVGAEAVSIDYVGSTQFTGDFSVNTQSQNGQPNGSLVAVDIADDGLVTASYSNGTQDLKGKIVLATFSTPNGLRQLGDSTFLESSDSGAPTLGEPGGAGFGTIRAGARERANVDLTSELVDLITAQRNFQANAKAIETSSTLTSTIINIRN
ncbi:flagellar hook-basal body complex protein [Litoricolaceae bacterium]|nr:flagellar hook-basal body complex protein [Litorivicinaceae bacterium]